MLLLLEVLALDAQKEATRVRYWKKKDSTQKTQRKKGGRNNREGNTSKDSANTPDASETQGRARRGRRVNPGTGKQAEDCATREYQKMKRREGKT